MLLAHMVTHGLQWAEHAAVVGSPGEVQHMGHNLIVLAQSTNPADYAAKVKEAAQQEQLGWLTTIGKHFIGVFQQGGQVFVGFVTGIIPTLVVLMTAFYAVIGLVGEDRVHGVARAAGRIALTRYTDLAGAGGVLPHQPDGLHFRLVPGREAQARLLRLGSLVRSSDPRPVPARQSR